MANPKCTPDASGRLLVINGRFCFRIIEYTGILNDKMCGFYASKYEKDGAQKTMAVTQFEVR